MRKEHPLILGHRLVPPRFNPDRPDLISDCNVANTLLVFEDLTGEDPRVLVDGLTLDGTLSSYLKKDYEERRKRKILNLLKDDWVSYTLISQIVNRVVARTSNPRVFIDVGKGAAKYTVKLKLGDRAVILGSTELCFRDAPNFFREFNNVGELVNYYTTSSSLKFCTRYYYSPPIWDPDYTNGVFIGTPNIFKRGEFATLVETHSQCDIARQVKFINDVFKDKLAQPLRFEQRGDELYINGNPIAILISMLNVQPLLQMEKGETEAQIIERLKPIKGEHYLPITQEDRVIGFHKAALCVKPFKVEIDGKEYEIFRQGQFYNAPENVAQVFWEKPSAGRRALNWGFSRVMIARDYVLAKGREHQERVEAIHREGELSTHLRVLMAQYIGLVGAYVHLIRNKLPPVIDSLGRFDSLYTALPSMVDNALVHLMGIGKKFGDEFGEFNHFFDELGTLNTGLRAQASALEEIEQKIREIDIPEGQKTVLYNQANAIASVRKTLSSYPESYNKIFSAMVDAGLSVKASLDGNIPEIRRVLTYLRDEVFPALEEMLGEKTDIQTVLTFGNNIATITDTSMEYTFLNLNDIVTRICSEYKGKANFNLSLELDRPVWGNAERIAMLLRNYITNSVESAEGKRVTVSISTLYDRGEDMGVLITDDDGPGIPEHARNRILIEPYTTKSSTGHTGTGLLINRTIMEQVQGHISHLEKDRPRFYNYFKVGGD